MERETIIQQKFPKLVADQIIDYDRWFQAQGIPIKISSVSLEYVLRHDHKLINNNNCWVAEDRPQPANYRQEISKFETQNWIYRFHSPETVHTLTLDEEDLEWMRQAMRIGRMTREFSQLYQDELAETVAKYADQTQFISDPAGWFVRTERVSLKNGQHGVGPYRSFESILRSLVTSNPGHDCFLETDTSLTLYLVPFLHDLDLIKEFRVFVYQNQITAISQQDLFAPNSWLQTLDSCGVLSQVIRDRILTPYLNQIAPRMKGYLETYTMDLALIGQPGEEQAYFIEVNPFGADQAAGSALFGWQIDDQILHDSSSIEFRYTRFSGNLY